MFDTVRIRHVLPCRLSESERDRACLKPKSSSYGKTFVYNRPGKPQLTYTEKILQGRPIAALSVEESLPKAFFGHNAQSLKSDEMKEALKRIGDYVENQVHKDFDIETAIVTRADAEHNFRLENELTVSAWLNALSSHSIPRFRRISYENTGIQFVPTGKSRERALVVYSKYKDAEKSNAKREVLKLARNVLRVEPRAMTSKECKKLAKQFNISQTVKEFLTADTSKKMISNSLNLLALNKSVPSSAELDAFLIKQFGTKANDYIGFIANWRNHGADFY